MRRQRVGGRGKRSLAHPVAPEALSAIGLGRRATSLGETPQGEACTSFGFCLWQGGRDVRTLDGVAPPLGARRNPSTLNGCKAVLSERGDGHRRAAAAVWPRGRRRYGRGAISRKPQRIRSDLAPRCCAPSCDDRGGLQPTAGRVLCSAARQSFGNPPTIPFRHLSPLRVCLPRSPQSGDRSVLDAGGVTSPALCDTTHASAFTSLRRRRACWARVNITLVPVSHAEALGRAPWARHKTLSPYNS